MVRCLSLACVIVAVGCIAASASPDPPKRAAIDALPKGAVVRLGTLRATVRTGGGWLALSPDGSTVAASRSNERVDVFDVETGDRLAIVEMSGLPAGFSRDGTRVAVTGRGGTRFFETATGKELTSRQPDLEKLVAGRRQWRVPELEEPSGGSGRGPAKFTIVVSDSLTGRQVRTVEGKWYQRPIVDLSPDGRLLAVIDARGLTVFDVETGERRVEKQMKPWSQPRNLRFSPDGSVLACADGNGTTRIVASATGDEQRPPLASGPTGGQGVLAFSPDGRILVQSTDFFVLQAINIETGAVLWNLPPLGGEALDVVFSEDGKTLVTCDFDGRIRFWDVASARELHKRGGHQGRIYSVACSPVSDVVATAGRDRTVRLWDLATGKELRTIRLPPPTAGLELRETADGGKVAAVAWSPKGDRLAVAGESVRLLDPTTGAEAWAIQTPERAGASSVAFSADGKLLAASGIAPEVRPCEKPTVRVWDLASGSLRLEIPSAWMSFVAFSPDGTGLASSSSDVVRFHDSETGTIQRTIGGARGGVYALAFSPDGSTLASGEDGRLRVFDAHTGNERWRGTYGSPVAWSPDGGTIACCGPVRPAAIVLLDAATGAVRHQFDQPESSVMCLAFSRDGRRLVSGNMDGTAIVWDLDQVPAAPR